MKRIWIVLLGVALSACGANLDQARLDTGTSDNPSPMAARELPRVITEAEIANLPLETRSILTRPEWNQPYINLENPAVEMTGPTHAKLMELMEQGVTPNEALRIDRSGALDDIAKTHQTSNTGTPIDPDDPPSPGEPSSPPPFCDADENGLDDRWEAAWPAEYTPLSYLEGRYPHSNYFNPNPWGGSVSGWLGQLAKITPSGNPEDPQPSDELAEVSMNSRFRLDCSAEAYVVAGEFWKRFSGEFLEVPNGEIVDICDFLIAPSSAVSEAQVSSVGTTGRMQNFYFGNASDDTFGGAMISSLESTTVNDGYLNWYLDPANPDYSENVSMLTRPVFGVLHKRWLDLPQEEEGNAASSYLGWPVAGPFIFNYGATLRSSKGRFSAFGMWYERGFIWWLDYNNEQSNHPTDEAYVFRYRGGKTVFDGEGTLEMMPRPVHYGGQGGRLGADVVAEVYRPVESANWKPIYEKAIISIPSGEDCQVWLRAFPFGGTPQVSPDGKSTYKKCFWDFGNGTYQIPGLDYSSEQFTAIAGYSEPGVYVVRVMVTDANDEVIFADSLPIEVASTHGMEQSMMLIRNDDGQFEAGWAALESDLTAIGAPYLVVNYHPTVGSDFITSGESIACWYRGGPALGTDEPTQVDNPWTDEEITNFRMILENDGNGASLFLIDQAFGIPSTIGSPDNPWPSAKYPDGYNALYGFDRQDSFHSMTPAQASHVFTSGLALDNGIGWEDLGYFPTAPQTMLGSGWSGAFTADSLLAAERYRGIGSSGKLCTGLEERNGPTQFSALGYATHLKGSAASPYFVPGISLRPKALGWDVAYLSWGNTQAPDSPDIGEYPNYTHHEGPGKLWVIGYGWADTVPIGCTRSEMLRNVISWLDPDFLHIEY